MNRINLTINFFAILGALGFVIIGWEQFWPGALPKSVSTTGGIAGIISLIGMYACWFLIKRNEKIQRKKDEIWLKELKLIADDLTLPDKEDELEDLVVYYEPQERKMIIEELKRMPKGSKNLSKALQLVDSRP